MQTKTAPALAATLVVVTAVAASARTKPQQHEDLLRVAAPESRRIARAHPFVNVVVFFGAADDGAPADASTFRARVGRRDVTDQFAPILENGAHIGGRARLEPPLVKIGRRPRNRLRLSIQAVRVEGAGKRSRDVDRLRFGASLVEDEAPVAMVTADADVVVADVPVTFDGSGSKDADGDALEFLWDFGDGATSTEMRPVHQFAAGTTGDRTVTLTVSDGQRSGSASVTLLSVPTLDPGKTPGLLRLESAGGLEFGAVAPQTRATRGLTIRNTDDVPTSQVKVRLLATNQPTFEVGGAATLALGPSEAVDVEVGFTPPAAGHHDTRVIAVATATNRQSVSFLAHGYGGAAAGSGPTLLADPLFAPIADAAWTILPDGRRLALDTSVGACVVAGGGLGSGDWCVDDGDCAPNHGTCSAVADDGFLPADMCSDGQHLFALVDDTFTDPDLEDEAETERTGTLVRYDLGAEGAVVGRRVLYRTTESTEHLACDDVAADEGGIVSLAEFLNVPDRGDCVRSEREALVRVHKGTGNASSVLARIDDARGFDDCDDDLDAVDQLVVASGGGRTFAGFEQGGLWAIRPAPRFFTPDVSRGFQVHPDGSIVVASVTDVGGAGLVRVYRLTDTLVEHGALPLAALAPCASFAVPNNALPGAPGRTVAVSIVAGPTAPGARDAVALASVRAIGASDVLAFGPVEATVAFALPPDTTTCNALGLVNLEALELHR